jgi:hypothetical protein
MRLAVQTLADRGALSQQERAHEELAMGFITRLFQVELLPVALRL